MNSKKNLNYDSEATEGEPKTEVELMQEKVNKMKK